MRLVVFLTCVFRIIFIPNLLRSFLFAIFFSRTCFVLTDFTTRLGLGGRRLVLILRWVFVLILRCVVVISVFFLTFAVSLCENGGTKLPLTSKTEDKTRQDKTRQDKTRQDKTRCTEMTTCTFTSTRFGSRWLVVILRCVVVISVFLRLSRSDCAKTEVRNYPSRVKQKTTRQDKTRQDNARQDKTRQDVRK